VTGVCVCACAHMWVCLQFFNAVQGMEMRVI
jgi:hypothetical protein